MSVKWMDDPSYYGTGLSSPSIRYPNGNGTISIIAASGRFGGNSWRVSGGANQAMTNTLGTFTTGTLAISFKTSALPGTNATIMNFWDTATTQVDVRVLSTGAIEVTRNGTVLATSTSTIAANVWYRIEFKATINSTTGVIQVKVNGVDYIASTGSLNTQATANASFNRIGFGGSGTNGAYNDFVFTDTNTPNADFLGDKRCYLLLPNADSSVQFTNNWAVFQNNHAYVLGEQFKDSNGNVQQCTTGGNSQSSGTPTWSTTGGGTTTSLSATFTCVGSGTNPGAHNWMAISEPTADGDSSYNADSTAGDKDLFTVPSLPAGAQNIAAVDNVLYVRKDDAGTARTIEGLIKSSGTTATGPSLSLSTSYQFLDQIQETDPNTGSAWTVSGVNAALVGYEEVA